MKRILLGVVAGLMVASCSKNETVSLNQDEIQFSVVTNKVAKAADLYCNNNLPRAFQVSANYTKTGETTSATYIGGDNIEQQADGTWKNTTSTRYWPEEGTLDFYAHVNAGDAFKWTSGEIPTIENFTVNATVAEQVDLLYATNAGLTKETTTNVVLNFRHALSQIVFQAKNLNEHLYVVIEGVSVCNVGGTNTFTFPAASTTVNVDDHDQSGPSTIGNQGTWGAIAAFDQSYAVTFNEKALVPEKDGEKVVVLTGEYKDAEGQFKGDANTMLLLPQTTTKWVPNTANKGNEKVGSYFLVKCRIYNVANPNAEDENGGYVDGDVMLWGDVDNNKNDVSKDIAIPVDINWLQGHKYIYTFVFGDGNGGFDPDEEDEVLTPITFTVSVDDFTNVANTPVEMEKKEEENTTTPTE